MASTVTLLELRTRARAAADMTSSTFVTDAELTSLVNSAAGELIDLYVEAGPPDWLSSTQSITVTGAASYNLAAAFRSLQGVYEVSNGRRRDVRPATMGQRVAYEPAPSGGTVELEYVANPTALSADGDTLDVQVAGADEFVVLKAARSMLRKEELDISAIQLEIQELRQRIIRNARSRSFAPREIVDVSEPYGSSRWGASQVTHYRLRGSTIELYRSAMGWT